jgi:hypothetical protein
MEIFILAHGFYKNLCNFKGKMMRKMDLENILIKIKMRAIKDIG